VLAFPDRDVAFDPLDQKLRGGVGLSPMLGDDHDRHADLADFHEPEAVLHLHAFQRPSSVRLVDQSLDQPLGHLRIRVVEQGLHRAVPDAIRSDDPDEGHHRTAPIMSGPSIHIRDTIP
jgi:hypothetical protein